MRVLVMLGIVCPLGWAQMGGIIQGRVTVSTGNVPAANVRARNLQTGDVRETTTSATGEYSLVVPAGTFDFFIVKAPYGAFTQRQMVVPSGASLQVNAKLAENLNVGTPGEFAYLILRDRTGIPKGPAPKASNGKPDLSGVWLPSGDLEPEATPYQPWAEQLVRERAQRSGDDPRAQCLPSGVPRMQGVDLTKFIQTPSVLVVLMEGTPPGFRQIFMGAKHPADLEPSWMGHSIATWEGDALVIDTIGFNDKGWLDGAGRPQTEKLHTVERFRRPDMGHLEVEITVDDAGAYTRPWKIKRALALAPGEEIHEYICNENNKSEHFVRQ